MSGQIHFSPLLKRIFPSCQRVKSGFSEAPSDSLADSGLCFPIGSLSPLSPLPSVWCGAVYCSSPCLLARANLLRLDTALQFPRSS